MKRLIFAISAALVTCEPARAETWQERATTLHQSGTRDARVILNALVAPGPAIVSTNTIAKSEQEHAAESNAFVAVRAFINFVGTSAADRDHGLRLIRKGRDAAFWTWADDRLSSMTAANNVIALRRYARIQDIIRESGLDIGADDFAQPTRNVVQSVAGPSFLAANGIADPPTVMEIDRLVSP